MKEWQNYKFPHEGVVAQLEYSFLAGVANEKQFSHLPCELRVFAGYFF